MAGKTIRMTAPAWVASEVRYTEGVGFEGNDAMIVRHLNVCAEEESVDTVEEALALTQKQFSNVTEIVDE